VLLQTKIERFITADKLLEMAHGIDTNINEAFNQICTWFAPKNKVFAGSGSLHNRIAFAVGINSLGYNRFFTSMFERLGIPMTDNVAHYLRIREKTRVNRLAKLTLKVTKQSRTANKRNKLQEDSRLAKIEFLKREGTYRKGMNVDDPYGEVPVDGNDEAEDTRKPAAKKRTTNRIASKYCEFCGKRGHATQKSKLCTALPGSRKKYRKDDGSLLELPTATAAAEAGNESEDEFVMDQAILHDDHEIDCHMNDLIPFDTEVQEDDDDMDLFHDAGTWSDNEDEDGSPMQFGVL
jgi:hypothetical protein